MPWIKMAQIVALFVNCTQNLHFFTLFCGCYIIYYYLCGQNLTILYMNNLLMQQELKIISLAYKTILRLAQIGCPRMKAFWQEHHSSDIHVTETIETYAFQNDTLKMVDITKRRY